MLVGIYSAQVADVTWLTGHTIVSYVASCNFPAFWIWKKVAIVKKVAEKREQRIKKRNEAGGRDEEIQV